MLATKINIVSKDKLNTSKQILASYKRNYLLIFCNINSWGKIFLSEEKTKEPDSSIVALYIGISQDLCLPSSLHRLRKS
jgi:hypothetical protein